MSLLTQPSPEFIELLKRAGSNNKSESLAAQAQIAKALELPLREGTLVGDIVGNIFERIQMAPGTSTEFPLDWFLPAKRMISSPTVIPATDVFLSEPLKVIM